MTATFNRTSAPENSKSKQHLTWRQKLLFGMVCWGVQSWSQVNSFKTNGYDQKYREAKKAMHTGLTVYGIGITIFILLALLYKN